MINRVQCRPLTSAGASVAKKSYANPAEGTSRHRWTLAFLGIAAIVAGSLSLLAGKLHYQNYFNALVFAPYAILAGIIAIVAAFRIRIKKTSR